MPTTSVLCAARDVGMLDDLPVYLLGILGSYFQHHRRCPPLPVMARVDADRRREANTHSILVDSDVDAHALFFDKSGPGIHFRQRLAHRIGLRPELTRREDASRYIGDTRLNRNSATRTSDRLPPCECAFDDPRIEGMQATFVFLKIGGV